MVGATLPLIFDQPGAAFTLISPGIKFPPIESEWQKRGHSFEEAAAHRGNVGVMAGNGYIGLDQDDPEAFKGLELPTTTKWETRPGRLGLWFRCNDRTPELLAEYGKKPDQAQLKLYKSGEPVGEIKLERTYQVIPPSWKELGGKRVDYRMLSEVPPAEIPLEWLLSELQKLNITFSEKASRLEQNAKKLEDLARERKKKRAETDDQRARRYAEAALKGEVEAVRSAPKGHRNQQLNDSAFALGQFVAAGALSESEVIRALASVAEDDEPEKIGPTIRSGLDAGRRHPREIPKSQSIGSREQEKEISKKIPDEITAKALDILQSGDPIQYIADSCGRMVLGAETAFKKLICCVAVQDIQQSAGLHPKLNGESGSGKSWALLTFAHHLPPEAVIKGSMSGKAGFYHNDGNRVLRILDDYQAGSEDIDTCIKQTSSTFHIPYTHRTVANHKALTLQIGSEQTWAITSVDSAQDIQVLNRQIPINVDDSADLTRKVNARTIQRYGEGDAQFPEDETVMVCREIWQILRSDGRINIRVPYWQRIDWLDTSNRRNPSIFMDLLIAITAMNRYQREKDSEGYYLATEDDFNQAKALFTDKDAEELVNRLTKKEREFADLLSHYPGGLTREEVAKALDVTPNRISQLANGEKGKGGLSQKLSGFCIEDVTDTTRLNDEQSRSIRKTVYKLNGYDPLTGFDAVVILRPPDTDKDGKPTVSQPVRKLIVRESITEREIEKRDRESKESKEKERDTTDLVEEQSKPDLSHRNEEKSLLKQESIGRGTEGILTQPLRHPYSPYTESTDADNGSLLNGPSVPSGKEAEPRKSKQKETVPKRTQSPEFERFKGLLEMYRGKGRFPVEEFLKRCDMSGIARVQAKRWIQAFTEGCKIKSDGSGMLEALDG